MTIGIHTSSQTRHDSFMLIILIAILIGIGLIMVTSTTAHLIEGSSTYYLKKQSFILLLSAIIGLCVYVWLPHKMLHTNKRIASISYVSAIILLALPLISFIGVEHYGAKRWIQLPLGFEFQTSQIAMVLLIISMSIYLNIYSVTTQQFASYKSTLMSELQAFVKGWVWVILPTLLLILQKDFGSLVIMFVVWLSLLFVYRFSLIVVFSFVPIIILLLGILIVSEPYRMQRVAHFLFPFTNSKEQLFQHANDSGYQIIQSKIALAQGGLFGVGSGTGVQKLYHLPKAHNDFIFSTIGEEYGILGIMILLSIYFLLIKRLLMDASVFSRSSSVFVGTLHTAMAVWLFSLFIIHVGSCIGLLPPKGTNLPLISYGGSNLFSILLLFSMMMGSRK